MKKLILSICLALIAATGFAQKIIVKTKKSPPTHSFDVLNYKLYLDLYNCYGSTFPKRYYATNTITLKADSALNSIKLNATNTSLTIDSVQLAGVSFLHASNILTINLDKTYYPGDTAILKIYYHHNDITTNMSDTAFHACDDGFVFTDCEPEGARKWFPCWDKPSDKATTDLTAKVPLNVKLGSNGSLKDSVIIGDTLYYHWASRDPMSTYLINIASKDNYNLAKKIWHKPSNYNDSIPIVFYYTNGDNISPVRDSVISVVNFYSQIFGEYPFEKIGYAGVNSSTYYGSMENQTLINMVPAAWIYCAPETHEMAHQWFGDLITCKTWADLFLNESFATYIEALWKEHTGGYVPYKTQINSNANSYLSSNPGWAISDSSWAIHTPSFDTLFNYSVSYNKGSCVLHMLRYVVGDSLFFKALKEYATDTNFTFGNASIKDFRNKVEAVTGLDLHWFFDEWIYKPNHPVYKNTFYITDLGSGNWRVDFTAKQIQTNPPFFKMPIELTYKFTDGSDTTIKVMNDTNGQVFTFYFTKEPTSVIFDKADNIVLKKGTTLLGIDEIAYEANLINISPNPSSEYLTLKFTQNTTKATIKIYNLLGELKFISTMSSPETTIDIADLAKGVYIVEVATEKNIMREKFVKE
jgi:aminopeptidase N